MSPARRICLRWQELTVTATGRERLRFSCECGGAGCPFDPKSRRG